MAQLRLAGMQKSFGKTQVIKNVDLDIANGEFVVFVGPSGCGKSTLLRLLAGLEPITGGDLHIDDRIVNELPPQERGIGMVFQSYALYPHMSVYENIAFGLKLAKTEKQTVDERVRETARTLQLDPLLERKPRELSGGQRQRVAMGRAMAREPGILLFDEPLSNLDASLRVQMRNEIAKLHRRLDATVIYVTHDQVEAMTLADKIVVLRDGSIEQVGSPRELYERPRTRFVASFIGSPTMNFLPGQLIEADHHESRVGMEKLGEITLPHGAKDAASDASVTVGIRPQHLDLGEPDGDNTFEIINIEYLGNETYVYLDTGRDDAPLVHRCATTLKWDIGQRAAVRIDPANTHLFDEHDQAFVAH